MGLPGLEVHRQRSEEGGSPPGRRRFHRATRAAEKLRGIRHRLDRHQDEHDRDQHQDEQVDRVPNVLDEEAPGEDRDDGHHFTVAFRRGVR